jgi:Zn-dependent M28 family amino/carboxypeptidase
LFSLLISQSFASGSLADIDSAIVKINKRALKKELRDFVNCCRPNRMVGSSGHLKSSKWLIERLNKIKGDGLVHVDNFKPDIDYAIKVYQNDFEQKIAKRFSAQTPEYQKWSVATNSAISHLKKRKNIIGKNIIWEKRGSSKPEEILVIGANYDTIAIDQKTNLILENSEMPGADDNGSGVALALSLIKTISKMELKKTIVVVFFDFQELGFLGARSFVEKYSPHWKKNKFIGFVNLLMLGHDSTSNDLVKKQGNMKAYIRRSGEFGHKKDLTLFEQLNRHGVKSKTKNTFSLLANSFDSSDIVQFWEKDLPAVVLTGDWENDYNIKRHHTANDFPETLNFNSLYQTYLYLAYGVLGMNFDLL